MYSENYDNYQVLFLKKDDLSLKKSFSSKVYKLLENAYKVCGGIKTGSGFKNETDMINNIPFWRLTLKKGELVSVMMFKEKSSRYKMVAYEPLTLIDSEIRSDDIQYMMNNSYAELSGALLVIVLKHLGSKWKRYILNFETIMLEKKITKNSRVFS